MSSVLLAGLASGVASHPAWAVDDDDGQPFSVSLSDDPVHQARQRAEVLVSGSLLHLSERLSQDRLPPKCDGLKDAVVARMSFFALAFMAAGHTTDHSPYATPIRRCVRWLTQNVQELSPPPGATGLGYYFFDPSDSVSKMHGHGYATWALALAYGMTFGEDNRRDRLDLERVLLGAIRCIERAQTETGGWGYEHQPSGGHEGSMTVTMLQALRAARDAGVYVDPGVITRAEDYLRRSQMMDGPKAGSFRYMLGDINTSYALTAAAVSSLNMTGVYDGRAIDDGIEYMRQSDPILTGKLEKFPWYSRLYATQAYYQYQSLNHFRVFYPALVDQLEREVVRAERTSMVEFTDSEYGSDYATALAVISLCVPFGYLPSFQR